MNKITVNDRTTLDALYKDWALTIEGLQPDDRNLGLFLGWIKDHSPLKREDIYIVSGSLMNREYQLTGDNAYPETNCDLVCVKLSDIEKPEKIVIARFEISGRWFTDVVDNALREEEKNR